MTDYLWDRNGPPDPDVVRLEGLLGRYRHRPRRRRRGLVLSLVGAAAAVAAAAVAIAFLFPPRGTAPPPPAWDVTWLKGRGEDTLALGGWLETGEDARARVQVADIGQVDLAPNTRVGLVATGEHEHRLDLRRGKLHALVYAPPRLFLVDTPAATAVDLGCAYTLEVDETGAGLLHVDAGHVELEGKDGGTSYVPRGASCRIARDGPGVPWFEGVPAGLLDPDGARLAAALPLAAPRDSLTLWHLIGRVAEQRRAAVIDRLAELAPPPPGAPLDRCRKLDPEALRAWRDELPLP